MRLNENHKCRRIEMCVSLVGLQSRYATGASLQMSQDDGETKRELNTIAPCRRKAKCTVDFGQFLAFISAVK